jgi:hypothetical protein
MRKTTKQDIELLNEGFRIGHDPSELLKKLQGSMGDSGDLGQAEAFAREIYRARSLTELKSVGARIDSFLKGKDSISENPFTYHFTAYAKMLEAQNLSGAVWGADTVNYDELGSDVRSPFL